MALIRVGTRSTATLNVNTRPWGNGMETSVEAEIRIIMNPGQAISSRSDSIHRLGEWRAREAVSALLVLLEDGPNELRFSATSALEKIKSRTATRPLLRMLRQSEDPLVRECACEILFFLGDRRSENQLRNILFDQSETSYLRGRAAQALGMIHPTRVRTVRSLVCALQDSDPEVRYSAVCGLSPITGTYNMALAIVALKALASDHTKIPGEMRISELAAHVISTLYSRPGQTGRSGRGTDGHRVCRNENLPEVGVNGNS